VAYKGNSVFQENFLGEGLETFNDFLSRFDLRKGSLKEVANPIGKVAFILDTDGRDEKWASVTALRFGAYLKGFGSQVFILCRDMKVSVDDMEKDYREARESGIMIFKYQDSPMIEGSHPNLRVVFKDASAVSAENPLEIALEDLDAVVVQEKILGSEAQEEILGQLSIPLEGGFVGPNNPQFIGRTPKKGVVVAGDTWFPEYLTDAFTTALSAAEELVKWVGKGTYQIDIQRVAEVDPSKCATCLTCYRICPHDSIRVERYGERNVYITRGEKEGATWEAARVIVETCNGCGLCASECPAKAIQLVYYPDLEVLEFMGRI
jgi:heterodisulfide reductase subunit A-like polyferredoxin